MELIPLATSDGVCTTHVFRPEHGDGPWPGVVFCIDGFGPRAALDEMAARIARGGYVVALPDLFHRAGSILDLAPAGVPREIRALFPIILGTPELRASWQARYYASAMDPEHLRADVGAVLEHLAGRADCKPGRVGVTGYCMGGNLALRVAAMFPDQIAAAASFHGGSLATDAADSPHLGAPRMKARVYVAGAIEDSSFTDEMKERLEEALRTAGVAHIVETYPARHGFCVADLPSYDESAAERHYAALASLFDASLG